MGGIARKLGQNNHDTVKKHFSQPEISKKSFFSTTARFSLD